MLNLRCSFAALLAVTAGAERFHFNFDEPVPYVVNDQGQRFMQVTQPTCNPAGNVYVCENVGTTVTDSEGGQIAITARLVCVFDAFSQVDFRRSQGCSCEAVVQHPKGTKTCPCTLCPSGYGDNPFSVDCDIEPEGNSTEPYDPFVLNRCTSYDCDFRCNGTCKLGCDEDPLPDECFELCGTPDPTVAPVAAPTSSSPAFIYVSIGVLSVVLLVSSFVN